MTVKEKVIPADVLKEAFGKYGTINEACRGSGRTYFITFSSSEEAEAAVAAMEGTEVGGKVIHCFLSSLRGGQGPIHPLVRQGRKILIHNVSEVSYFISGLNISISCFQKATYEDFKEAVEKIGKVTDFYNTGFNYAFITFSTKNTAMACVAALDKTEVAGRTIEMKVARERRKNGRRKKMEKKRSQKKLNYSLIKNSLDSLIIKHSTFSILS